MIPRRPRPLCAICADREATTITDWECESGATRTIVACWPCLSPVPDPPEEYEPVDLFEPSRIEGRAFASCDHATRDGLLATIDRLGPITFGEVLTLLGGEPNRSALRRKLTILERDGKVTSEPIDPANILRGKLYRATGTSAAAARLATLPAQFTWRDIDTNPRAASGVIRALIASDLIERCGSDANGNGATWRRKEQPRAA